MPEEKQRKSIRVGEIDKMINKLQSLERVDGTSEYYKNIEHTAHYAWNMQRPTQRILPDNTTKQPLLMGILEVEYKFS